MKTAPAAAALAACWVATGLLSPRVTPNVYAGGRSRDALERVVRNQSALAAMLGEFRTSLSDLLFIKTERYLHSGVAYVPHLAEKVLSIEGGVQAMEAHQSEIGEDDGHGHDHDHDHDHDHPHDHFHHEDLPESIIPTAEADYRGWIGEMHRRVKPWRDPKLHHLHTDGTQLLPWFRMMTLSDPGYTRGYTVGSYWLKQHDPQEATAFLKEGLRHNPEAFELHLMLGFLHIDAARAASDTPIQSPDATQLPLLLAAKDAFQRAAHFMSKTRPPQPADGSSIADVPGWSGYQETDAMSAANMAVSLEIQYGDRATARQLAERYAALMPDNKNLKGHLDALR